MGILAAVLVAAATQPAAHEEAEQLVSSLGASAPEIRQEARNRLMDLLRGGSGADVRRYLRKILKKVRDPEIRDGLAYALWESGRTLLCRTDGDWVFSCESAAGPRDGSGNSGYWVLSTTTVPERLEGVKVVLPDGTRLRAREILIGRKGPAVFVCLDEQGAFVRIGGVESARYDAVLAPGMSDDASRFACTVKKGRRSRLLDCAPEEKTFRFAEGKPFKDVWISPYLGHGGSTLAAIMFSERSDWMWWVVTPKREDGPYAGVKGLTFGPAGRMAYVIKREGGSHVVADGRRSREYTHIGFLGWRKNGTVIFAANRGATWKSGRYTGGRWFVVDGDRETEVPYKRLGAVVEVSDREPPAYVAVDEMGYRLVRNRRPGKAYEWIRFHPPAVGGGHAAFIAGEDGEPYDGDRAYKGEKMKMFVVVDGKEGKRYRYIWGLTISKKGTVAYVADAMGERRVVVGEREGPKFWKAGAPAWSPDGRRVAYYGMTGDGVVEVIVETPGGDRLRRMHANAAGIGRPFFLDATTLVYCVKEGHQLFRILWDLLE